MATVIRLKRGGRTHAPYYRMVVVDSRAKITGRVIEELGIYQPCARPEPKVTVNEEQALHWLGKGAQPSNTARDILSRMGIMAKFVGSTPPAAGASVEEAATADAAKDDAAAVESPVSDGPSEEKTDEDTPEA